MKPLPLVLLFCLSTLVRAAPHPETGRVQADGRNGLFPLALQLSGPAGRMPAEIQLSVGVRFRVIEYRDWSIQAFYRQQSFWDGYDFESSGPFRESTYNPGAFFRSPRLEAAGGEWFGDLGYSHESNGRGRGAEDRSWDRIIARANYERGVLKSSLLFWWRIPKPERVFNDDAPIPDGNPLIYDTHGIAQWEGRWEDPNGIGVAAMARFNPLSLKGALEVELSYPLGTFYVAARYFDGYGESLLDYDQHIRRLTFGILLTR